ncbi:MAG: PEP/pyruvate-binding domain-containing protein, partial [Candidatus Paceibacterota bacterium]
MSVANPYNKGGKAQSLQRLSEAGFRVPPFFLCDSTWSREDILNKIKSDLRKSNFFAVRSSAEGEDSAQKSFAGHFYSAVAIKKGQVYDEVKKVCASFKGLTGSVIIQEFIASDSAGVMFSEVEGGKVVINSTLGMCFPVVNGQACDEYICHKNGRIVSKTVQDKSAAFFREGVISTENTKKESLNSEEISELTDLAQRIQKLFRSPQDIEWCFKENKLYVLQSRPITRSFKIGEEEYFDSANIAESYSGIVLPLTCTFARMVYERVYKDLLAMSGVSRKKIERYSMIFENLLGFFYGRMYYNMNNWYHLAEFVPGYERNKKNFEGMITSNIREEVQKAIKPSLGLTVAYPFIVALKLLTYGFATRLFKWRVNKYLRELRQKDFGSLSYAECIKLFHKINEKLLNKWYVTLENDFFVMTYLGLLKKLLKEEDIQKAIVFESKATEQVKAIADLSAKIYEDQSLWASVQSRNINDFQVKIKGRLDMNTSLQEYLSSFGGRFANELKLESIGVDEDVGKLLDVLKAYHDHQPRAALKPQKLNISFARNTIVQLILWKFRKYASRREEFRLLRS